MTNEVIPGSVSADDHLRVVFVPEGSNPLSVAVLGGATTKSLTYSLTPSGFNRTTTEDTINDERLTLSQLLQKAGRVTEELEVQYVFGAEDDIAAVALTRGTKGFIVARYAVPNATDWAVGQKVDVIPIECGKPRKDAPAANATWTKTQKLLVTDLVQDDALLIA